jgi:hypothetical protein
LPATERVGHHPRSLLFPPLTLPLLPLLLLLLEGMRK